MTVRPITHSMTATAFAIEGYRTTRTLGVVRGVTVRSRSIFGSASSRAHCWSCARKPAEAFV